MSEAQHKSQGLVAISVMVQVNYWAWNKTAIVKLLESYKWSMRADAVWVHGASLWASHKGETERQKFFHLGRPIEMKKLKPIVSTFSRTGPNFFIPIDQTMSKKVAFVLIQDRLGWLIRIPSKLVAATQVFSLPGIPNGLFLANLF